MEKSHPEVSKVPVTTDDILELSKSFDKNSFKLKGIISEEMLEFFGGDQPLHEQYEELGYLDPDDKETAEEFINDYRVRSTDDLLDRYERQEVISILMSLDLRLGKYDGWYFRGAISDVRENEELLKHPRNQWVEYITYRYRKQITDKVIYEEKLNDELKPLLGDDLRQGLEDFFERCKESYELVNNRYDDN